MSCTQTHAELLQNKAQNGEVRKAERRHGATRGRLASVLAAVRAVFTAETHPTYLLSEEQLAAVCQAVGGDF